MFFSEKALETRNADLELLENAFWANIYLGNINRALKIVSDIELSTDEYFAELALWLGVDGSNLVDIFPNLENFYTLGSGNPIGFLNI